jgi:hypothetical protein
MKSVVTLPKLPPPPTNKGRYMKPSANAGWLYRGCETRIQSGSAAPPWGTGSLQGKGVLGAATKALDRLTGDSGEVGGTGRALMKSAHHMHVFNVFFYLLLVASHHQQDGIVESLQSHFILTMSHWLVQWTTRLLPITRDPGSNPQGSTYVNPGFSC